MCPPRSRSIFEVHSTEVSLPKFYTDLSGRASSSLQHRLALRPSLVKSSLIHEVGKLKVGAKLDQKLDSVDLVVGCREPKCKVARLRVRASEQVGEGQ